MIKLNPSSSQLSDAAVVPMPPDDFPSAPRRPNTGLVVALIIGGVVASLAGVAVARVTEANKRAERLATMFVPGVHVAGLDVSGLSRDAGAEKVRAWAKNELSANTIALVTPRSGKRFLIPLSLVGGRFDTDAATAQAFAVGRGQSLWSRLVDGDKSVNVNIEPVFKLDEKALTAQMVSVGKKIAVSPVNARAEMVGGVLQVTKPEQKGVALDVDKTRADLLAGGTDALKDGESVTMTVTETAPKVTADNLGGVNTLIGSFSTSFGSSAPARQSNIRKATAHLDGTLIAPGEVFSYNDTVGPRLPRLGWRNAPTYQDGQVVPGPGGGICQTSTTLFNAVLRANLEVVERRNHSMPVHYVPPGCDATVDYGSTDFKFRNTTDAPIYLSASSEGGRLRYNLYGAASAKPGEIDVETGAHHPNRLGGFSVAAYKVIHQADGTTKREYIGTSSYRPMATR